MRSVVVGSLLLLAFLPAVACTQLLGDFEVSGGASDASTSDGDDGGGQAADGASTTDATPGPTPCSKDDECPPLATTPPNCAKAKCAAGQKVCVYGAVDADGDGHPTAACESQTGVAVERGDDCDDNDRDLFPGHPGNCSAGDDGTPVVFPGGGPPKGRCRYGKRTCVAGKPSACTGVVRPVTEDCATTNEDEDCDGSNVNGCPCTPINAVQPCDTHPGLDGKGICKPGSQTCAATGWSTCTGSVGPAARNCSSATDNDCSGAPDNTIDTACQCAVGSTQTCNTHPGLDNVGVCKAGSRQCFNGSTPSTSQYALCAGDVGPTADDCNPAGTDLNCDGIRGNGAGCTVTVGVYVNTNYTCGQASSTWPLIFMTINANPPAGFSLLTQFKLLASAATGTIPIHRCFNSTDSFHYTGFGACTGGIDQGILGHATSTNGGNGWVELATWYGRDFGPTALMRMDDPKCCSGNCNSLSTKRYVLK